MGYEYHKPGSLEELAMIIDKTQKEKILFLAGGTDLWADIRTGKKSCSHVIDLKGLPALNEVEKMESGSIHLGALVPIHKLESDLFLKESAEALTEGVIQLGSYQVRNRATLGGNLANASPTADAAIPLLALEASLELWSPRGSRYFSIDQLWQSAGKTHLMPDEIICRIIIPAAPGSRSAFLKLGPRRAMDIAVINVAVRLSLEDGLISSVRIALGGAADKPFRATRAEEFLIGKMPETAYFAEAGRIAAEDSRPRSSRRASGEYRLSMIPVLTERALTQVLRRLEYC